MIHLLSGPGRIDLAFPPSGTFKLASSQEEITDPKARNHIIAGGLAMNDWERSMNGNQFSFEELDSLKKAYFDTLSTPPSGDAPGGETANARTLRVLRERHLRLWSLFDQGWNREFASACLRAFGNEPESCRLMNNLVNTQGFSCKQAYIIVSVFMGA